MTKVFFDTEFTGLHQATTLLSIGLVTEHGDTFYAELIDYDQSQINDWLRENVLAHFTCNDLPTDDCFMMQSPTDGTTSLDMRGTKQQVAAELTRWLTRLGPVQMWSDCLAYDWVLFNSLLANYEQGYPQLPGQVSYIPMDICTLFQSKGIDPDTSREEFGLGGHTIGMPKHNARWDAKVIKACYDKLTA